MAGEEWARRILQKALKQTVVINDDGSAPSMYDLRIGSADAPEMAIECVGAVDPIFTETWNIGPARGPMELRVTGDWTVVIAPEARVKAVKQRAPRRVDHQAWIDPVVVDPALFMQRGDQDAVERYDRVDRIQSRRAFRRFSAAPCQ